MKLLSDSAGHEPAAAASTAWHPRAGQHWPIQVAAAYEVTTQGASRFCFWQHIADPTLRTHHTTKLACSALQFCTNSAPAWLLCPTVGPASTAGACSWHHPASPRGRASWPQCQQPRPCCHLCWGWQGHDFAWPQMPSPQHRVQPLPQGWGPAAHRVGLQRLEVWPLGWLACQCCPCSCQQGMAQLQ